jgi:hypothetical protein
MVLNLILALVTLSSALSAAMVMVNREVSHAIKSTVKQYGWAGCSLTMVWMTSGLIVAGLWSLYAYQVHEWRFAAIIWVPIIFRWIGIAAEKAKVIKR